MGFNAIKAFQNIAFQYQRYLNTVFSISDSEYQNLFLDAMKEESFAKGPYLDVTDSFLKGKKISDLVEEGLLAPGLLSIDRFKNMTLHRHQEEAIRKSLTGDNLVISTGTGSGKTECFLIPILNGLMKEVEEAKQKNTRVEPGVRALIIYPMNALANDQMDRLRKLLISVPEITFGSYTGQTKYLERNKNGQEGAYDQYIRLHGRRDDDDRLRTPLPNEILSRERMKKEPPHILITNYAMLEYLMLRPEDSVLFSGPYSHSWSRIVLDEAHTYTGSTGIEVAMLLRRLQSALRNNVTKPLQFYLTSATLGDEESNEGVIDFAKNLTGGVFYERNVIRASRVRHEPQNATLTLSMSFYTAVHNLLEAGYDEVLLKKEINEKYPGLLQGDDTFEEALFDLLLRDKTFWTIKDCLDKPRSVEQICRHSGLSEEELNAFVNVASKAIKNDEKLFDARYHAFLRAPEGTFVTLPPHKSVSLHRINQVIDDDGRCWKAFEAVTCSYCHSLYLVGYEKNHELVQLSFDSDDVKCAFLLGDHCADDDEEHSLEENQLRCEPYKICPHCGYLCKANEIGKDNCPRCGSSDFVRLIKVATIEEKNGRVNKCVACENANRLGVLRGLYSGQEASTSVIGTALFEELPSEETRVCAKQEILDDGFGFSDVNQEVTHRAKQFLAFSDSRQAAAYFSTYFSVSYEHLLFGRIFQEVAPKKGVSVPLKRFVEESAGILERKGIIPLDEYLEEKKNPNGRTFDYVKLAWAGVLRELTGNKERHSLIGLGLLGLCFEERIIFLGNSKYGLSEEEVKGICLVFALGMIADCAIDYPQTFSPAEKEYFAYKGIESSFLLKDSSKNVHSFLPRKENASNKRLDYFARVMSASGHVLSNEEAKKILESFWSRFFAANNKPQIMTLGHQGYKVSSSALKICRPEKWYRCDRCHRLTQVNVKGVCPTYHCDGHLHEANPEEEETSNHYYRLYHDLAIEPLRVVEHTAQLNKEEGYFYQSLFKNHDLDVLSCSTTFEMGVDVGSLETVFMRNVPPSPSNYAQRAGRAGRSRDSAAFALTFCNKSNHDFYFYAHPEEMIAGSIQPPSFNIANEKISIRHIYSSAFGFFFKNYPEYFKDAATFMEGEDKRSGYDAFKAYLESRPNDLREYLIAAFPCEIRQCHSLDAFGWLDGLFGKGTGDRLSLYSARAAYLRDVDILSQELKGAQDADASNIGYIRKRIRTYRNEGIVSFLSRSNVLPKYGFPVDTVSLFANYRTDEREGVGDLDLSRDLSVAISEYAPGCEVVANGKLVTSRYIQTNPEKGWRSFDFIECPRCKTMNVEIHNDTTRGEELVCKQCGEKLSLSAVRTFIVPEFGFVADRNIGRPSLVKPERNYHSEAAFVSYDEKIPESSYCFGESTIKVAWISQGPMAILNRQDFWVCPACGYAEEADLIGALCHDEKNDKKSHLTPTGRACSCHALKRYSLGYLFKTDVIRIRIDLPLIHSKEEESAFAEAYSLLQGIVLAAGEVLDLDESEISGCLQRYNVSNGDFNYSYVLYDKTPGGAGHVKRLNDFFTLSAVLETAYARANSCRCGGEEGDASCYLCLRTYQNRKYHDLIKRKYVIEYLGVLLGK